MFIIFLISILFSSSVIAFDGENINYQNVPKINVMYVYENKNLSSLDINRIYDSHLLELDESFRQTYSSVNAVFNKNNFDLVGSVPYPSEIVDENLSLIDFSFYKDRNSQYLKDYYKELNFIIEETNANLIVFLGDSSKRNKDVTGKAKILAQGLGQYLPYKNKEQLYTTLFLFDNYASGDLTFVHELGHLLGGAHADEIQSFYSESIQNGIFAYSKSFGEFQTIQKSGSVDAGFSTILGYHQVYNCVKGTGHDKCTPVAERNNIFSNPKISICGPTNKKTNQCGLENKSDMAKTIETTFPNFLKIKDKSSKKAIVMGYGHDPVGYMTATSGEDYIFGTVFDDNGAEKINARAGNDYVFSSVGSNEIILGNGSDVFLIEDFDSRFKRSDGKTIQSINEILDFTEEDYLAINKEIIKKDKSNIKIYVKGNDIIFEILSKIGTKDEYYITTVLVGLAKKANSLKNSVFGDLSLDGDYILYSLSSENKRIEKIAAINNDINNPINDNIAADKIIGGDNYYASSDGEVIIGDNDFNALTGNNETNYLFGKEGDDDLKGYGGEDYLFGGQGHDYLFGGDDLDFLWGDEGNDVLLGGYGVDVLNGGDGDDILGNDYDFTVAWDSESSKTEDWHSIKGSEIREIGFYGQIYEGGFGNDTLYGTNYGDYYYFDINSGYDVIREFSILNSEEYDSALDMVSFDVGIFANDFNISRDVYTENKNYDVILENAKTNQKIRLEKFLFDKGYEIEMISFKEGDILWNNNFLKQRALTVYGTDSSDEIQGLPELNDVIYGKYGDDFIFTFSGNDTIYGSNGNDIINGGLGSNTIKSGADNDAVFSRGNDNIYLGTGNDVYYNSIEQQSTLHVYENEGVEEIHTCYFSEDSVPDGCSYDFNEYVTQKTIIHYDRDESIENYYKENNDLILEIGTKNKFVFKDAFLEDRIQYDITYQDSSSIDWNQLKSLANIPEEDRNILKNGDYFEIFDESDNGTYYVPEGAIVTFGEYRSGEVVNNGTIITETIKYDLNMSGNGSLEIKNTSGMRNVSFNDGDILLSGYYSGGSNVSAKTIIIDYIHKHPNGINYQYIYGSLTGDVIVRNSLNDSDYSILNNLIIKGSLTIENNVLATSGKYSRYSKSQIMKIYGRFVNNGEFNNIDIIDSSSRKSMVITLYDYIVNSVVIEKASFSDGAFEQIKGSVSIYSTNIYDYDLSDLDILTSFENGVNEINVDSNLTLGNYNGRETTFNVKNGSTLIIKSYTGGDFHIEDGSKVVIESFGRYPQPLDITGNGVLEIKNTGGMNSVNFLNGTVLLSGYSAGGSIKAKTIIVDYLHKHVNDIGYQYIGGVFEGNVIFRNSLNDSDYGILSNLTIRGSLTIEENVFITSREYSRYSKSQTMKIYGKFVNKGEFDNISIIDGSSRKSMVITLYDYIVDDVIVEKASFNGGAFDKIKGSVSIYSSNIYDYDLTNLKELTLFENGTNKIEIDKDFVIANYEGRETTFNIKNNSTLILKSYKGGKFNIEDGSKVVIESFGRYPQPLDITGNGVLEIKNTGGMNSVNFLNGTVLLSGYVASGSVKAKTIIVDYLDKNVNDIGYQHIGGIFEGNVIFRNSLNDSDYGVLSNLTIRGSLTIEENVFITSREYSRYSQSQTMKIYGKFVNKGEFDNISIIDGSSRKSMVITLYDYIVDDVIVEKASFNGGAFEQIKGSVSIYSTNIYDYDLDNLDIFTSFENGINDINVDSNLTLGNYNGRETTFNVKNGSTLRIKSYVGGKFNIEDGAKVVIENFGRYPQSLNISGRGVLEIKNTYNMRDINFFNGVVLLSGYNAGGNVKAKTIVADYIHKLEGRDYQYIHGNLEGNVIFRNSLNDSDYIAVAGLIIKGALTIEENTLVTSRAYSRYSSSQTIKVYGKFLNNGDFNNVESIANQSRSSLNLIFYDYVVNDIVIEKASFNNGAFKNIKGSLNIYSENIYDFNLSEVSILKSFNNGTDSITIDKDYTVGSYSGHSQTMVVKSGSTLRFKEYIAGDLIIENGAKVIIDSFGRYARDLDVLGGGILEIRNSSGINNIKFYGGKVIFSGYIAGVRSGVHAKDIVFNKIYGEENHQIIRSETITGNVIIKSNSSIDYIYMGSRTLKVYGYLTMESDVVLSSGTSSTYYLEVHGLLNNNGLLTDKILVRDQSSGRLSIRLYDNIDKNILANLNELGNYDISGYIYLNGTNIAD